MLHLKSDLYKLIKVDMFIIFQNVNSTPVESRHVAPSGDNKRQPNGNQQKLSRKKSRKLTSSDD